MGSSADDSPTDARASRSTAQDDSSRHRPAIWPVLVAYLVALVLVVGATTVVIFGVALARAGGRVAHLQAEATRFAFSAPGVMTAAVVSATVLALDALVTARLLGRDVAARLRLGPTRATPVGVLAAVAGMAGLSLAAGAAADRLGVRHEGTMEDIARALAHASPAGVVLAVLTIAVAPGIAEELFFRGLLQTRLVARLGRWGGIIAASLAFGLMHMDPVQSPLAFALGLFLGWVVERFGGIRPSIAAHAVNNAIFVAAASFGSRAGGGGSHETDILSIAAGAVVWLGATLLLRSRFAVR
jgi:membrane protease YdiL (CAAX protease family)